MDELLRIAKESGWRLALSEYVMPRNPRVVELILDSRRGSFQRVISLKQTDTVLDFGCGFGGISRQIADKCAEVVSLDSGFERLHFLRLVADQENLETISTVHNHDPLHLPFADGSFDVIVLVGVFEYLPLGVMQYSAKEVQARVLRELNRILKPGGTIYMATKNRFGWNYITGGADHNGLRFGPVIPRVLANALSRLLAGRPYRIIVDSVFGYRRMFRMAGFEEVEFYWPVSGYQTPDGFVPLTNGGSGDEPTWRKYYGGVRRPIISMMSSLGLLKYVVPIFSITAKKGSR